MLAKNVPYWSVLAHIFETIGWNNVAFLSQCDIGIIHSFSVLDLGMTPCDLELFLGGGGGASGGRPLWSYTVMDLIYDVQEGHRAKVTVETLHSHTTLWRLRPKVELHRMNTGKNEFPVKRRTVFSIDSTI